MTTTQPKRQPIPFGKYLLLDRINIGGMAEVWRGKMFGAGGFERLVAIKRILPNIAEDEEFISMFIDEAKISVQLTHANIAQIHELGQISNSYFIAMEYIPGKDMRAIFDRCRKKGEPAPVPLVAYCVSKMCEGLDYAHRKKDGMGRDLNIVHRDISPQNVLISYEGEVKVIDFGIAKAAGKATKTQAGILKGKFGYMSPEQIRGLPLDRRSDIFAIGVCLYEMLTGERLFVGDSDFSVLEKVRKAEVLPPTTYNRRIPEALERIVLKALARDVDERYQHANELGDDLQRFLITSDSIFSRKDLMQYMKSTFAEEVEREKLRLQEYATIEPPEGMRAAIEMGFGGMPVPAPPLEQFPATTPAPSLPPMGPPSSPQIPRRAPSLTALPKLTAAAASAPLVDDDEGGATMLVDSRELLDGASLPPRLGPGRTVTPLETHSPMVEERPPPPIVTPRAPVLAHSPAAESTNVARPNRPSLDGMRAVRPESPPEAPVLTPGRKPTLGAMPVPPRAAPPPFEEEPLEEEEEATEPPARPTPSERTPVPASPNRMPLIAGVAVLLVLLLGIGAFFAFKPPPSGFLLLNLPGDVQARARVNVNGQDLKVPPSGPILHQIPAGPALVLVSVDGHAPFTQSVEIVPGTTPTPLEVKLERTVQLAQLVITSRPADAELRLDGKVVRAQGSSEPYLGEVEVGSKVEVELQAKGYKPFRKQLEIASEKPVALSAELERDGFEVQVSSYPTGALVFADGKELGETPLKVRLAASVKEVSLKKRCYEDAELEVAPSEDGSLTTVKHRLKKIRGCR